MSFFYTPCSLPWGFDFDNKSLVIVSMYHGVNEYTMGREGHYYVKIVSRIVNMSSQNINLIQQWHIKANTIYIVQNVRYS